LDGFGIASVSVTSSRFSLEALKSAASEKPHTSFRRGGSRHSHQQRRMRVPRGNAFFPSRSRFANRRHRTRVKVIGERLGSIGFPRVRGVRRTYHDARVDVSERAQAEQIGAMLRVVEAVRGCLVNGQRARVRRGIGDLARVHLKGLELELVHDEQTRKDSNGEKTRGKEVGPRCAVRCGDDPNERGDRGVGAQSRECPDQVLTVIS